jgi:hypothetical protein
VVPAQVGGLWCGAGGSLLLVQAYQEVRARQTAGGVTTESSGRLRGGELQIEGERLRLAGDTLQSAQRTLRRAPAGRC